MEMIQMYNNKFDYLIPKLSKEITECFLKGLQEHSEIKDDKNDIDTSPLLNMTSAVFIGSLLNILDVIKENTIGEVKLIKNIELTKSSLIKTFKDLPFVSKVEFF